MTVFPGFGGQKFMAEVVPKIERSAEAIAGPGLDRPIQVDGGIDERTAPDRHRGRRDGARSRQRGVREPTIRPPRRQGRVGKPRPGRLDTATDDRRTPRSRAPDSVLVVDDDDDIARYVELNLLARGVRSRGGPRRRRRHGQGASSSAPTSCCST